LTAAQWEQVRLHPYVGERVLARCAGLADVAALVGAHHERVDGSGYHRGARDPGRLAVLLATADAYQAMGEDRAHRRALVAAQRRAALRAEAEQGRLPQWAVDAVLAGPGEPVPRPAAGSPVALTSREREVLALVARGQTNRAIAANLGIAAKTVNAHLEHIFTKLGVTTRGAAAFYAVDRGLLDR
jgi:DNA-binding NarL/FixJ family response regulator